MKAAVLIVYKDLKLAELQIKRPRQHDGLHYDGPKRTDVDRLAQTKCRSIMA